VASWEVAYGVYSAVVVVVVELDGRWRHGTRRGISRSLLSGAVVVVPASGEGGEDKTTTDCDV
jgi:hypothetical protein